MSALLSGLLSGHGAAVVLALFTFISLVLNGVASYLAAIGDKVPGWLGTMASGVGSILHLLNGNVASAAPSDPATK